MDEHSRHPKDARGAYAVIVATVGVTFFLAVFLVINGMKTSREKTEITWEVSGRVLGRGV